MLKDGHRCAHILKGTVSSRASLLRLSRISHLNNKGHSIMQAFNFRFVVKSFHFRMPTKWVACMKYRKPWLHVSKRKFPLSLPNIIKKMKFTMRKYGEEAAFISGSRWELSDGWNIICWRVCFHKPSKYIR